MNDDESNLANPGFALFGVVWIPDRGLRRHFFIVLLAVSSFFVYWERRKARNSDKKVSLWKVVKEVFELE